MITFDFETKPIDGNTSFNPPEPVGVSIKKGKGKSKYYAWGHPTNNNCTWDQGRAALAAVWDKDILGHNTKFDVSVALKWFDFPMPDWDAIHDTMYLLFLNDPYSDNLSLKPNSARLLNLPPEEQDRLQDWIMTHTPCSSRREAGAWIYAAPGDLVGEYACSDTDRTFGLFQLLAPQIEKNLMWDAYQREQRLMPITYYSELKGVRVDVERLGKDLVAYEKALVKVESMLLKRLKRDSIDFGKAGELADALESAGLVGQWVLTPTGKRSISKDNLERAIADPSVLALLRYRGAMAGCLQTFARPWASLSAQDGRIHTSWNQVRTHDRDGGDSRGSRTGRLSASKPSLMNVTNELKIVIPKGLPPPPLMRQYLLPELGHKWLKRDYSSQEVRWLAHFADGVLLQAYKDNPGLDPHEAAMLLIEELIDILFPRKDVKITAFSIVYGSGVNSLAEQLSRPKHEAALIKTGYLKAFPDVEELQKLVSRRGKSGQSIRTWGGREYYVEPPKIIQGRRVEFAYKLLNYLIQGSSADQTKDSICTWWDNKAPDDVFLATVHDEINESAPEDNWEGSMAILREAMDKEVCDCPMRSEGFVGDNWFDLEACA